MNKTELVSSIAEKTELSKKDAELAVNAFIDTVSNALAAKESVQLIGFGTFTTVEKAEHVGRNPKTGNPITIPASTAPKFKPGQKLKDLVNNA